jgi:hypothetical protein
MTPSFKMKLKIKIACSNPDHVGWKEEDVDLPARRFLGVQGGFCEHCIPKVELLDELPKDYRAGIKMHIPESGPPENVFVIDINEDEKWSSSIL